jgi:hypothetical protein
MRYLIIFSCTVLLSMVGYSALIPLIGPTPISAEYWVSEMLMIKRDISKKFLHKRKFIIASGSSTLFSIDTRYLSDQLGIPVINFGLMGGLSLNKMLSETDAITNPSDVVILALEPDYYCRENNSGYDEWLLRNALAWDQAYWYNLRTHERLLAIWALGLRFPLELIRARVDSHFRPDIISPRLDAQNAESVLRRFASRPNIPDNLYSVYTMDDLGNIKNTSENNLSGKWVRADQPFNVCKKTLSDLKSFVAGQRSKMVEVYFIHVPYVDVADLDFKKIKSISQEFSEVLASVAPVLDKREDVIFDPKFFLNSPLHLNSVGREIRSKNLLPRLRNLLENK